MAKPQQRKKKGEAVSKQAGGEVLAVCALLALAVAAVYWPVTRHQFVSLDDPYYYQHNPHLDGRFGLDDLKSAFAEPYFANWIPVTSLSIALDQALYGAKPAGFLVTNVVLHALASILLFLALRRLTHEWLPSACVAAVFALHPLHVESVAWASQRKDVLFGLFWMATLYVYARYVERPDAARYAAVLVCAALSLLSKPAAVTLPFVLLLLDVWPLRRVVDLDAPGLALRPQWRRALLEKLPLLALAAGVSAVTLAVQEGVGAVQSQQVPFWLRVGNAGLAYADYLRDSVWPRGLAVFYPYPAERLAGAAPWLAFAFLALVTGLCVWLVRRRPALLVGWLWFLGTLVPAIGLVQVGTQGRADRYMYVPLVGLAIALFFGALEGLRVSRRVIAAASALALCALGVAAHAQVRHWRSSLALFEHAIAVTEGNHAAHESLGSLLHTQGELDAAERQLREALRIRPQATDARVRLGLVQADRGRFSEAREEVARALAEGAKPAGAHAVLGMVAERAGDPGRAVAEYYEALEQDPQHYEAANNLAWLLATSEDPTLRDPETAVRLAESLRARGYADAPVLDTLAAAYAAAGRYADAVRIQEQALKALLAGPDTRAQAEYRDRLDAYRTHSTQTP